MENRRTDSALSALPVFVDELRLWSHPRFITRLRFVIMDWNDAGRGHVCLPWITRASRCAAHHAVTVGAARGRAAGDHSGNRSSGAHGATGTVEEGDQLAGMMQLF